MWSQGGGIQCYTITNNPSVQVYHLIRWNNLPPSGAVLGVPQANFRGLGWERRRSPTAQVEALPQMGLLHEFCPWSYSCLRWDFDPLPSSQINIKRLNVISFCRMVFLHGPSKQCLVYFGCFTPRGASLGNIKYSTGPCDRDSFNWSAWFMVCLGNILFIYLIDHSTFQQKTLSGPPGLKYIFHN